MPRMTAPITHAGMPKKKRTNGYSATNSRNTHSSTGRIPPLRAGRSAAPTMPGITVDQAEEHGERLRPRRRSTSVPKYHRYERQTITRPDVPARIVGTGPRGDPPDLAVEHLVGPQDQLVEHLVLGTLERPDEHAGDARQDHDEHRRRDVERADPEPRIVRAAPPGTEIENRPAIAATVTGRPADGEAVAGIGDEARPAPPRPYPR